MSNQNEARNKLGQTIAVGDFVAYPVRQSSSMWMSYGVVTEIVMKEQYWNKELVPVLKVMVASGPQHYDHEKRDFVRDEVKPSKKTVSSIERVVVLDINTLRLPIDEFRILRAAQGLAKTLSTK